jgi:hypothetical protein
LRFISFVFSFPLGWDLERGHWRGDQNREARGTGGRLGSRESKFLFSSYSRTRSCYLCKVVIIFLVGERQKSS